MTFLSCMFVVILLTFCIDFVQINMYVCMQMTNILYARSAVTSCHVCTVSAADVI